MAFRTGGQNSKYQDDYRENLMFDCCYEVFVCLFVVFDECEYSNNFHHSCDILAGTFHGDLDLSWITRSVRIANSVWPKEEGGRGILRPKRNSSWHGIQGQGFPKGYWGRIHSPHRFRIGSGAKAAAGNNHFGKDFNSGWGILYNFVCKFCWFEKEKSLKIKNKTILENFLSQ